MKRWLTWEQAFSSDYYRLRGEYEDQYVEDFTPIYDLSKHYFGVQSGVHEIDWWVNFYEI